MSAAMFVPYCRYPQGSLEDWRHEVVWAGKPERTRALAQRQGLRHLGHDDFNIGVLIDGCVTKVLWMTEDIGEEQAVMDEITAQLRGWVTA